MKERADKLVVARGLAESRRQAQALIMAGSIFSGEERIEKPGQLLDPGRAISRKAELPFVSRGGLKLDQALDKFDLSVAGKVAIDLGSSTGGFTDCLLQRGAEMVYAVDVDPRQLDWRLQRDPRVVQIHKNARYLDAADFPRVPGLFTMDLAFISVLKVLPALARLAGEAPVVSLIKPQFEAGRGRVGRKGVIRDPARHAEILARVIEGARNAGFHPVDVCGTSIRGQKGNREFFVHWSLKQAPEDKDGLRRQIEEAVGDEKD